MKYYVDTKAPSFSVSGTWVNEAQALTISISASDAWTWLHATAYKCGSEEWKATASCSMWTQNEPTSWNIVIKVRDKAWNESSQTVRYEWKNVKPTANNVSASANEWSTITLTANVSDPGWTTNTWYQWYSDSACSTEITNETNATYTASAQTDATTKTYSYKVKDAQWLWSECATATATWNNVVPTWKISNNGSKAECTELTYTFSGSDTWGGTLKYEIYSWGSCAWTALETYTNVSNGANKTWTKTMNKQWTYVVSLKVTDANNGTSTCVSSTATWSNTAPSITTKTWDALTVTWTKSYGNVVTILGVSDGSCGASPITATLVWCTKAWSSSISSNTLSIVPDSNTEWAWVCTIKFADDEWSIETWYVKYYVDTTGPEVNPEHGAATSGYVNSWDIVQIPLDVTEWKWINTWDFEANDIHVYVNWVEKQPTKELEYDGQLGTTYRYILTLRNLTGDGQLRIEVLTWSFTDIAWNPNGILTWMSKVEVDNTNPTCNITQSPEASTQTNGNVTLTANVTETNPDKYSWTWFSNMVTTQTTFITWGNGIRTFYMEDKAWNQGSCQITVSNIDKTLPQITLTSSSDQQSTTQRLTWTCTDDVWVIQYYIWSSSTPSYVNVSSDNFTTWINIPSAWTYYFFCKDAAWNVTSGSKIYDSYTVNNMLEKITWTRWQYNTGNYDVASSGTYIAPRQTTLTLASIYTVPSNASSSTYTWFSTSSSIASPNTSATTTLNGTTTYYTWFDRERYHLDLIINTWINLIGYKVNGAGSYAFTQSTLTNIETKAWSTIYAYAEPKPGYTYTETNSSNPWSTTVTWNNTFSPMATANTNTQYVVYHYVKRVWWQSGYALSRTDTWYDVTDTGLILANLAKESELLCAHYDRWSLTWTEDWPWAIVTQTTVAWDGSTKIYLYYTRNSYNVTVVPDAHTASVSGSGTWECGSEVPVDAIPDPWYHFVRWDREERQRGRRKVEEEWGEEILDKD